MPPQLTRNLGKFELSSCYDFCDWALVSQPMLGLQLCFIWVCLYRAWQTPHSGSHYSSAWWGKWNLSRQHGGSWTEQIRRPAFPDRAWVCCVLMVIRGSSLTDALLMGWSWRNDVSRSPLRTSGVLVWAFLPLQICPPSLNKWFELHSTQLWNGDGMLKAKLKEDSCN